MSQCTTKPTMASDPREDSDQPGHLPSLITVFTVCMKKACVLRYPLSTLNPGWSESLLGAHAICCALDHIVLTEYFSPWTLEQVLFTEINPFCTVVHFSMVTALVSHISLSSLLPHTTVLSQLLSSLSIFNLANGILYWKTWIKTEIKHEIASKLSYLNLKKLRGILFICDT